MTIDEAIEIYEKRAKSIERSYARGAWADGGHKTSLMAVAADYRQLAEWLRELKEAKRLLQAAEKTIDEYCRGYCECCKNRDFELARCGLVNGCRDRDNWEWILSYRIKELFKEG